MDAFLGVLGLLFFMFLLLSAAVEAVLEVFRGTLEAIGIKMLKGKISIDDALKLSDEFAPGNTVLKAKAETLAFVAAQLGQKGEALKKSFKDLTAVAGIKPQIAVVPAQAGANLPAVPAVAQAAGPADGQVDSDVAQALSRLTAELKAKFDESEGRRIWMLRALSAAIGCVIVGLSDFEILTMLSQSPEMQKLVGNSPALKDPVLNVVVGGFAAAAGSSFWHDQLDKVRKMKEVGRQVIAVVKQQ